MSENKELRKIYDGIKERLILKKKFKEDSVIISLFTIKSNVTYKILKESAIVLDSTKKMSFQKLESLGLIRLTDETNLYCITAKGVWEIEKENGMLDIEKLVKNIDGKFFESRFFREPVLSDKEKVLILSFIAIRAFSKQSSLDLKSSETALEKMQNIITTSFNLLKEEKLLQKLTLSDLFGKRGNEHPVSNVIRHTDQLLKKTRGIYQTMGNQRYFLNLYPENNFSKNDLIHLFGSVFQDKLTIEKKDKFIDFLKNTAYNDCMYLYSDLNAQLFLNPAYDSIIDEALEMYLISKNKYKVGK